MERRSPFCWIQEQLLHLSGRTPGTCPLSFIQEAVKAFDTALYDAVTEIVGAPLSNWAWRKATLPVSLGGLGFRMVASHASAAFFASVTQSASLVTAILGRSPSPSPSANLALSTLASMANRPEWISADDIDIPIRQHCLSRAIDQANFDSLLEEALDSRSKALALSSSIHHAGDWLQVVPSTSLGLHLADWEFRLCMRYWLGLQIVEEDTLCAVCGCTSDVMGDHYVTCRGNGDLIRKHDALRDVLYTAACSAALAPKKEMPALIPGSLSRPADIYLPCWSRGKPAALDVSVISPVQALTVEEAAVTQGYSLAVREQQKRRCHDNACHEAGIHFIPLAVETFGGWSSEAAATIRQFGKLQAYRLGL